MLTTLLLTQAIVLGHVGQEDPQAKYKTDLVPIGKKVPSFTVKDENGVTFDLYKSVKKDTKATLINFWFAT
jgi:cytochrome oxidase Cu insertion factor (SCO1/SenC/PrrC family)